MAKAFIAVAKVSWLMQTVEKRVSFTDFIGTLMVYPIWLMPTLIAVAYAYPYVDLVKLFLFSLLVFLGQNLQHRFHRFMGKSTFKAPDPQNEKKLVILLTSVSLPLLGIICSIDVWSFLLSVICLTVCFAYTVIKPLKEYLWVILGFTFEFITAYRFLSLTFPSIGWITLHSGISLMISSWLVGYRVMTGDYGPVPLSPKNVLQHALALIIAVPFLALGILWH